MAKGAAELARVDRDLASVLDRHGPPPLWDRPAGFPTLIQIILEQQVSLASARAAFERLKVAVSEVTPKALLGLDDAEMKAIGFSRQKARYCRQLSRSIVAGAFQVDRLSKLPDQAAKETLMGQLGIGRWTADIYLLMALRRPDVWPKGDLALAKAAQQVKCLQKRPDQEELEEMAKRWKPWRAVAARMLWHHYLSS